MSTHLLLVQQILNGSTKNIRMSKDKKLISALDVIKVVSEIENPLPTWNEVLNQHGDELNWESVILDGQPNVPCVNAEGLIILLMVIPGKKADEIRSAFANILGRIEGGDTTVIDEVKANNEYFEQLEKLSNE